MIKIGRLCLHVGVAPALAGLMALLLAASAARAAPPGQDHDECEPGPEVERCVGAQVDRMRQDYELPAIADLAAEGVETRRAFFVRGAGGNVGAVSFTRRPGEMPRMRFQSPAEPGRRSVSLDAEISAETWRQVLERSRGLFHDVAAGPTEAGGPDARDTPTCFHSWGSFIEATGASGPGSAGQGDRDDERCSYAIGTADYSGFLAALTLPHLPPCAALSGTHYRSVPDRLYACTRLGGDRLAAAMIVNSAATLSRPLRGDLARHNLRALFAPGIVLRGEGREVAGREAAATEWRRLLARHRDIYIAWYSTSGTSADRGQFEGILFYMEFDEDDPELRYVEAPLVASFARDSRGRFRIERIALGAFVRQPS